MLETYRCRLIKLEKIDYEDVKQLYSNEKVRKYLGGIIAEHIFRTKFSNMYKPENGSLYWIIRHKDDNQFIGLISLDLHHDGVSTEVSYQLLPKWWGHGYATEVVNKVIFFAFKELNLTKVIAETQTANKSSCKLLKKIGMNLEQKVERFGAEQSIFSINNTF